MAPVCTDLASACGQFSSTFDRTRLVNKLKRLSILYQSAGWPALSCRMSSSDIARGLYISPLWATVVNIGLVAQFEFHLLHSITVGQVTLEGWCWFKWTTHDQWLLDDLAWAGHHHLDGYQTTDANSFVYNSILVDPSDSIVIISSGWIYTHQTRVLTGWFCCQCLVWL